MRRWLCAVLAMPFIYVGIALLLLGCCLQCLGEVAIGRKRPRES